MSTRVKLIVLHFVVQYGGCHNPSSVLQSSPEKPKNGLRQSQEGKSVHDRGNSQEGKSVHDRGNSQEGNVRRVHDRGNSQEGKSVVDVEESGRTTFFPEGSHQKETSFLEDATSFLTVAGVDPNRLVSGSALAQQEYEKKRSSSGSALMLIMVGVMATIGFIVAALIIWHW